MYFAYPAMHCPPKMMSSLRCRYQLGRFSGLKGTSAGRLVVLIQGELQIENLDFKAGTDSTQLSASHDFRDSGITTVRVLYRHFRVYCASSGRPISDAARVSGFAQPARTAPIHAIRRVGSRVVAVAPVKVR